MSNLRHELNPSRGHPAEPTGRLNSSSANLNVKEDPKSFQNSNLNKSLNRINETYLDENSRRGDGANVISDRLNFGGGRSFVEGPPQIQYVPKEIIKEVYEDEYLPATTPVDIMDDSININGKNILAETMAKAALLIMENNRLRWVESQRTAELTRLRSVPIPAPQPAMISVVAPPLPPPQPTMITVVAPPPPPQPVITIAPQPAIVRTVVEPAPVPICPTCHRAWPGGPINATTTGFRSSHTYTTIGTTAPLGTRISGTTVPVVTRTSGATGPIVARSSISGVPVIGTTSAIRTIAQPTIINKPPIIATPMGMGGSTVLAASTVLGPPTVVAATPTVVRTSGTTTTLAQPGVIRTTPTITTAIDGQTTRTSGTSTVKATGLAPTGAPGQPSFNTIGQTSIAGPAAMNQVRSNGAITGPSNTGAATYGQATSSNFNTAGAPGMIKSSSTAQYTTATSQQPQGMMRSPTMATYSGVSSGQTRP